MLSQSTTVHVMLLMAEGHQYELSLASDAPLLQELFDALRDPSSGNGMLMIPNDEEGSVLYIPRESIVAIATDPPVAVETMRSPAKSTPQTQNPPEIPVQIIESVCVQLDNFLPPDTYRGLIANVFPSESSVESNSIRLPTPQSFAPWRESILNQVGVVLPEVLNQLGIPGFALPQIEAVGIPDRGPDSRRSPNDNGTPETAVRVLSFVYYFYQEPKPFTGGELLIYDSKVVQGVLSAAESFKTVEPRNNSIVFFLSSCAYETLSVNSKTPAFSDRCFRVRGWLRR